MNRSQYPNAERRETRDLLHGRFVPDPYRWLEDAGSPATAEWLASQEDLFREVLGALPGQEKSDRRVRELLAMGSVGAPAWRGDVCFFLRRTAVQDHPVLYAADSDGRERALIDPMAIDPTGATVLDSWQPSADGRLIAYQVSAHGKENSVLHVADVTTGADVEAPIDRCRYSPVAWLPDGSGFYYVRSLPPDQLPAAERQHHRRVYWHAIGRPADDDVLIFGTGREKTANYGVGVSSDGRWLTVTLRPGAAHWNDVWIADLTRGSPDAPLLRAVQEGDHFSTRLRMGRDGRAYLLTEAGAPRGRLCVADPSAPSGPGWRELVPEDPEAVLTDLAILDGEQMTRPVLLLTWTRHAISEVTAHDLRTGEQTGVVPLPGRGSVGSLADRPEGGHEAWFSYTDYTTPGTVYCYNASSGATTPWALPPGASAAPDLRSGEVTAVSRDGTPVRVQVVSRPDAVGPRPTLLFGYGGFGTSMTPFFSPLALTWVEAGGVYAVAGLRGGGEEGADWHRAGMLGNKQNSFDDCHAAAERLIADGWTTPGQLGIFGMSNGGLLVGAAITQRPELYAAAVSVAPLLDMIRYEQSGLGDAWRAEYGSAADPEQFLWLLAYSPYHRVEPGTRYPATMFAVFDGDTRVDPMHARKMCAAMQHATSGNRPVVLRREASVGHGARAASSVAGLVTETLRFLAAYTGLGLE